MPECNIRKFNLFYLAVVVYILQFTVQNVSVEMMNLQAQPDYRIRRAI